MATQQQRREETRRRLLEAAHSLFVEQGFDGTSTEDILRAAGVSRGALYHHFATKLEVFEAVFVQVSDAALERASRHVERDGPPIENLIQGCLAWLRETRKPAVGAILLELGPQALGWKRARELEAKTSLGLVMRSLERAAAAGQIDLPSVPLAARFVNAAVAEAALASRYGQRISMATVEASLRHWLSGLSRTASS